jgi:hypothetical protein
MFGSKLKISDDILKKVRIASEIIGAASIEEFAAKILETESDRIIASTGNREATAQEVEDIANKLKGLGYLE